jgi:hypothetical protein
MNSRFRDFTYQKFSSLLECFQSSGYAFQSVEDFVHQPLEKSVILRHDVDRAPQHSLITAGLERSRGIRGTYYFRIVRQSKNPRVIKEIAELGHEIGYHYEDLVRAKGNPEEAIKLFRENLEYFRRFYPVKTICMHGSPASGWDNRELWKKYSYRDFGILAEPYYDLDYNKILYLTDTGGRWDGGRSSVRDKVIQEHFEPLKQKLRTTDDILSALIASELPGQLMITVHPQRWSDNVLYRITESSMQIVKNIIKQLFFVK